VLLADSPASGQEAPLPAWRLRELRRRKTLQSE
jgi:hypothetical protein